MTHADMLGLTGKQSQILDVVVLRIAVNIR